jgi:hypothetical protein
MHAPPCTGGGAVSSAIWPVARGSALSYIFGMDETRPENAAPGRPLTPAARRALEEAAERRRTRVETAPATPELGGVDGPEPTRFGDWERKGIASDF